MTYIPHLPNRCNIIIEIISKYQETARNCRWFGYGHREVHCEAQINQKSLRLQARKYINTAHENYASKCILLL